MTEAEIMKALECCKNDDCDHCQNNFGNCYANLAGFALDLINSKNAEIEKMKLFEEKRKEIVYRAYLDDLGMEARIKAEAIKEFAERLKLDFGDDWGIVACGFDQLDQIAKEMGVEL